MKTESVVLLDSSIDGTAILALSERAWSPHHLAVVAGHICMRTEPTVVVSNIQSVFIWTTNVLPIAL